MKPTDEKRVASPHVATLPDKKPSLSGRPSQGKLYLLLHAIILLYSLSAVCSKMAATAEIGSPVFFGWFALVLVLLGIYALVWQQVLKRISLTAAYANKGITMVWGMLWGMLLFSEQISIGMMVGAVVVFVGILLVVTDHE